MVVATQTQFNERNPRYYTCCCCHVRTGVVVISIIDIVIEALVIISAVFREVQDNPTMSYVSVELYVPMDVIIMVVCAVLAIIGMRSIKPAFLIPHIVMQVFNLVVILYLIILAINKDPSDIIVFIIMSGLILVFKVWFLVVFVVGYKYLKEKTEFLFNNQNRFVAESVPMTGYNPTVYAEGQQAPGQMNFLPNLVMEKRTN